MYLTRCAPRSRETAPEFCPEQSEAPGLRAATPPGTASPLKSRGDIDPIAENIIAVDDDIAEIHPNAILNARVICAAAFASARFSLHIDRATDGILRAAKFYKQTIACRLNDPPPVFGDFRVDQFSAMGSLPG